jgi:DNA-binding NtrC family response regulator
MQATGAPHILVVEDNADYRRLVVRILKRAGFRVTEAAGFAEAMSAIEGDEEFALLLSDIGMPAGTPHGFSIGAIGRRHRPDLRIVYMTGGQDASQFSLFGRDATVLQKPFTGDQLIAAIKSALAPGPG